MAGQNRTTSGWQVGCSYYHPLLLGLRSLNDHLTKVLRPGGNVLQLLTVFGVFVRIPDVPRSMLVLYPLLVVGSVLFLRLITISALATHFSSAVP